MQLGVEQNEHIQTAVSLARMFHLLPLEMGFIYSQPCLTLCLNLHVFHSDIKSEMHKTLLSNRQNHSFPSLFSNSVSKAGHSIKMRIYSGDSELGMKFSVVQPRFAPTSLKSEDNAVPLLSFLHLFMTFFNSHIFN